MNKFIFYLFFIVFADEVAGDIMFSGCLYGRRSMLVFSVFSAIAYPINAKFSPSLRLLIQNVSTGLAPLWPT